jgi:hypothetical protein
LTSESSPDLSPGSAIAFLASYRLTDSDARLRELARSKNNQHDDQVSDKMRRLKQTFKDVSLSLLFMVLFLYSALKCRARYYLL